MMLFPEDPKKRPQLWEALSDQLARQDVALVVNKGGGDATVPSKRLSSDEIEALVARMKGASISRISANRGVAIGPHFSGQIKDWSVTITDFVTTRGSSPSGTDLAQLQNDLETAALNLLYGGGQLNVVRLPIRIAKWNSKDLNIQSLSEGIEVRKAD
jgi:hypothetical protein